MTMKAEDNSVRTVIRNVLIQTAALACRIAVAVAVIRAMGGLC